MKWTHPVLPLLVATAMSASLLTGVLVSSAPVQAEDTTKDAKTEHPNPYTTQKPALKLSGKTKAIDLPEGSAKKINLEVEEGRFANQTIGNLKMRVDGINYQSGTLNHLWAEFEDATFENVPVEYVQIESGSFAFNTFELLNHRRFVLNKPTNSQVTLRVSEDGLNRLISHPKVIESLEKAVAKQMGNVRLITFTNPKLDLQRGDAFHMDVVVNVGSALAAPVSMDGKIKLIDGNVRFTNVNMVTAGAPLPVEVAPIMEKHLNKLVDFRKIAKKYFVINTEDLAVSSDDLTLKGQATLQKLDIGL